MGAFVVLLVASTIARWTRPATGALLPEQVRIKLPEYGANQVPTGRFIEVAYRDLAADTAAAPTVVLIHGSPMGSRALNQLIEQLRGKFRLIVPDLPGFGGSSINVADYSVRTHALNVRDLLDALSIPQAHLVGYSQGGGVILNFADLAPERTQSLTLLSAIGVQELELLGDYTLNHTLYGAQWVVLWAMQNLLPHFGFMDNGLINVAYARNFYDTDQRPLRGILEEYKSPMLILHGATDALVPLAAAREHARIVPQSTLTVHRDEGHLIAFTEAEWIALQLIPFIHSVERGIAPDRAAAAAAAASGNSTDLTPVSEPANTGSSIAFYLLLLVLGAQVSEDLTSIAGGILAAQGVIGFWPAVFGCLLGIFIGDTLLFVAGRLFGRPALKYPPLSWCLSETEVNAAEKWFHRRGAVLIFLARFIPGSRLPTYFAAGALRAPMGKFVLFFMLAAIIWTPTLVGLSMLMGKTFLGFFEQFDRWAPLAFVVFVVGMLTISRVVASLVTWEGRRLMLSRWRRLTRWEFWPLLLFNTPVFFYVLCLGRRFRGAALFTLVNPAMPHGGFAEESKSEILAGLAGAGDRIGRWRLLDGPFEERLGCLDKFRAEERLSYPIVLKPDRGQRGEGVKIIPNGEAARCYLENVSEAVIAQEFLSGREFGVFYVRYPSEPTGRVWGITDKRFTSVTGDGRHSLRHLILADDCAVNLAKFFLREHLDNLNRVPADGEKVTLAELGTHCRGSVFLDGSRLITPALEQEIDSISQHYDGFYFGRYDVRAASEEALRRGDFRVIELNGVTSEPTWIYDSKNSVGDAWKTLMQQWRMAFEIADQNRARGLKPSRPWQVIRLILRSQLPQRPPSRRP